MSVFSNQMHLRNPMEAAAARTQVVVLFLVMMKLFWLLLDERSSQSGEKRSVGFKALRK
jgi:hypothetical protein